MERGKTTHKRLNQHLVLAEFRDRADQFQRDESGVLVAAGMFFLLIMLMFAALGMDFMRAEMNRTALQQTLDRAVLAAADLDQTLDSASVVRDYFDKSGVDGVMTQEPVVLDGLNYRTVSTQAEITTDTLLMGLLGIDSMTTPARATAEERITNVEISLVLDISGSMDSNGRMGRLRTAAKEFIDSVIQSDTEDLISVSIVPYSENVNIGPSLFAHLPVDQLHDYSHCLEFEQSDFDTATIRTSGREYEHAQFFQYNNSSWNDLSEPTCPRYDYERVQPWSQNATKLKNQIDSLRARAGTAIFMGMKWGVALLDPSMQDVVTELAKDTTTPVNGFSVFDQAFKTRPAAHNDTETLKTVVLMTDGANSSSYRIEDVYYNSNKEIKRWRNNNMMWWLNRNVSYWKRSKYYYRKYHNSLGDSLLRDICDSARAKGIVVWSIGFEVNSNDLDVMRYCASSPQHFFEVNGVGISDAFATIARQINYLRLTQ